LIAGGGVVPNVDDVVIVVDVVLLVVLNVDDVVIVVNDVVLLVVLNVDDVVIVVDDVVIVVVSLAAVSTLSSVSYQCERARINRTVTTTTTNVTPSS